MKQGNRNGGQDVFYFPVRHFPVDGAIYRSFRLPHTRVNVTSSPAFADHQSG